MIQRISRRALVIIALMGIFLVVDVCRAPERQLSSRGLLLAIDAYQATFSKTMPSMGVHCRFRPTCSYYTEEAIRRHGLLKGIGLGTKRILRCGPWTEADTLDPPPP